MKILYAIQGTGNGHLSRATVIIPILKTIATVDVLVSGYQSEVSLPFKINYQLKGLGFAFGKNGGIDYIKTLKNFNLITLIREIRTCPVEEYDLVINDFEPISAWASYFKNKKIIGLSHQIAVLDRNAPQLKKGKLARLILKNYAPAAYNYGFHFEKYSSSTFTPIVRNEIRTQKTSNKGHYTVYLPAYSDDNLVGFLTNFDHITWEVFSKTATKMHLKKGIMIYPIHNTQFVKSLASCEGVLCGAGFETPSEALFLGKKLMVIPMKKQYEQQCNALALEKLGISVAYSLDKNQYSKFNNWFLSEQNTTVTYPDETLSILTAVVSDYNIKEFAKEEEHSLATVSN